MQIQYVGPHVAVEVPDAGIVAARDGDPIDVDDALAKRLLAQPSNWRQVKDTTKGGK